MTMIWMLVLSMALAIIAWMVHLIRVILIDKGYINSGTEVTFFFIFAIMLAGSCLSFIAFVGLLIKAIIS